MKIERFKKLKNGQYEIVLNEGNYTLHEDLILKYDLLLKREVTEELLFQLLEENQRYVIYDICLKMLSRRLRSKKELVNLLTKKGYAPEKIEEAIALLEKQGYLNDLQYASSYVHDRILLSYDGPKKIETQLTKNGIDTKSSKEAMAQFSLDIQKEKITKIIQKERKTNRTKSNSVLNQKIVLHLVNLGYDRSLVLSLLESNNEVDVEKEKELATREYQKLYQKLSRKYEGRELELKIRQKMYQKGFTSYE